ncbi:MAG TPA: hypothetical protein VHF88_01320 [Thermoleophilaceae bacterium]|nr:hypothetical protein [Thermoleophilaceae bacterium]
MVALGVDAAEVAEGIGLGGGLDALGDGADAERLGELEDRLDDGVVLAAGVHAGDEGAVDLEDVDGQQVAQVAQGRVADAEVVDREADAELGELAQRLESDVGVGDHCALGDLEAEPLGLDAGIRERRADDADEVVGEQLARGDVDGHREVRGARAAVLLPARNLVAGLAQHPLADRQDQAGPLGDGDEAVGRDGTERRMVPAHQGLDADHLAAAQVDGGLVVEPQLTALDGVA